MEVIGVKEGMKIGIAGAGKGYFTFKMSKLVGDSGMIYANEIKSGKLDFINNKSKREGITNIITIITTNIDGNIDKTIFVIRL